MEVNKIYQGHSLEVLKTFPDESIDMCITSPPYWLLRDYGVHCQLGLEPNFKDYINNLCNIFDEVKRILKPAGTCWVNLGDTYSGSGKGAMKIKNELRKESYTFDQKPKENIDVIDKCLLQIPSMFSIEMINRGWILRNEIIWHKPNCMPSSATDRFTIDFEKLFFFVKNKKYYFEQQLEIANGYDGRNNTRLKPSTKYHSDSPEIHSISRVGGERWPNKNDSGTPLKNKRAVWSVNTTSFKDAHFAVYPEGLIKTPINAGCPESGIILDPFMGSGTTGVVAKKLYRNYIGIELNLEYIKIAEKRIDETLVNKRLFK